MNFSDYLNNIVPLSKEAERELISSFHKVELKKGELLFRQNELCQKIYFIEKGIARVYYVITSYSIHYTKLYETSLPL